MQTSAPMYVEGFAALPKPARAALLAAVVALHGVAIWALLQLQIQQSPEVERAPVQVNWITDAPPQTPQPETAPTAQKSNPAKVREPEPERVIAAKKPVTQAETFTAPAKPVEQETPKPVVSAAPAAQAVAAPSVPRVIGASALRYKNRPQPVYPQLSKELGEQGLVSIATLIGVDGRVQSARVVKSSGFSRLDNAALRAVQQSSFYPHQENGVAVAATVNIPFNFNFAKAGKRNESAPAKADKAEAAPSDDSAAESSQTN